MSIKDSLLVLEAVSYIRERYAVRMYWAKVHILIAQGHLEAVHVPGEPVRVSRESIDRLYAPYGKAEALTNKTAATG